MTESAIECSVVIPCLNEERTVGSCVRKAVRYFQDSGVAGEVVVVDNGSADRSVEEAAGAGARVVRHEKKGYGSALKRGIEEAHGRYVVMGDADDTYDFSEMGEFLKRLRAGDELVMGSRLKGKIEKGAMPWLHRYVGTPVLTWILNRFFKSSISDTNCGMRGFRRDAIRALRLKSSGMEFASEMVVRAAQAGLKMSETPISYRATRGDRVPHLHTFRDGWRHLRFMLVLCPRWLFLYPGLFLFLAGLVLSALLMGGDITIGGVPMGLSAGMFAGAVTFVGMQVAMLGVFGMVFYGTTGLLEDDRASRFLRRNFTLERGLVIGGLILLAGLALGAVAVWMLAGVAGPGRPVNVHVTRLSIVSIFMALLGIQVIFFSFSLSLFDLSKTLE